MIEIKRLVNLMILKDKQNLSTVQEMESTATLFGTSIILVVLIMIKGKTKVQYFAFLEKTKTGMLVYLKKWETMII
jgi:hypothetical protein